MGLRKYFRYNLVDLAKDHFLGEGVFHSAAPRPPLIRAYNII